MAYGVRVSKPANAIFTKTAVENDGNFAPQDWALFLGVSLIWGASFLLIAESLEGLTPGMVTFLRVGFGAATLWILRVLFRRGQRTAPEDRTRVGVLGVLWVAIPFTLFPLAQQWVNSAVAGLLNGATPLLVALVALVFMRVAPTSAQIAGLVLGFGGMVLIAWGSASQDTSQAKGVILIFLATCCYGVAINLAPPLQAKYGAIVLMSNVLGIATLLVTPFAFRNLADNSWGVLPLVSVFVLGSIGTGIAYWIMTTLVGRVGSLRASFITYLIPIVSLGLGVAIRNDTVSVLALIGAPITLVGAFLASRKA